jgi:hypothetical protein
LFLRLQYAQLLLRFLITAGTYTSTPILKRKRKKLLKFQAASGTGLQKDTRHKQGAQFVPKYQQKAGL